MSVRPNESQDDVIARLRPACVCPPDLCLGEDGGCEACHVIDPEWDCLVAPCPHDWTLRPESDTSVCEICGDETTGLRA